MMVSIEINILGVYAPEIPERRAVSITTRYRYEARREIAVILASAGSRAGEPWELSGVSDKLRP